MRIGTLISFAAAAILMSGCVGESPRSAANRRAASSQLPPQIEELKSLFPGRSPDEIRRVIVGRFGPAPRDVGSGYQIEEWDVGDGVLTFHPAVGPSFTPKGQSSIHLLATHNPAKKNLIGTYEMYSLAADDPNSVKCWLGNLHIQPDLSYSYKDSRAFPAKSALQTNNFFYLNPAGTVEIQYAAGVSDEALLEALPSGGVVAWLHFQARDGYARQTFSIAMWEPGRRLVFGASTPLSFEMDKSWESFWK